MEKTCSKCGEVKGIEEFHLSGYAKKDGTKSLDSWCRVCRNEYQKRYPGRSNRHYEKHRAKVLAKVKARYDADPEKHCAKTRKWRESQSEEAMKRYNKQWHDNADRFVIALQASASHARKHKYEPCTATVQEIRDAFTGFCAICGAEELEKKLLMDHSHQSGDFRNWLCRKCNSMLGFANDSPKILASALQYLEKHSPQ